METEKTVQIEKAQSYKQLREMIWSFIDSAYSLERENDPDTQRIFEYYEHQVYLKGGPNFLGDCQKFLNECAIIHKYTGLFMSLLVMETALENAGIKELEAKSIGLAQSILEIPEDEVAEILRVAATQLTWSNRIRNKWINLSSHGMYGEEQDDFPYDCEKSRVIIRDIFMKALGVVFDVGYYNIQEDQGSCYFETAKNNLKLGLAELRMALVNVRELVYTYQHLSTSGLDENHPEVIILHNSLCEESDRKKVI